MWKHLSVQYMYIHVYTHYLLISDVFFFVNYLGVDLQCALSSIDCHKVNSKASVICTSHSTFFGFSFQKQCHNDSVKCVYETGGNLYEGDRAKCPNVSANQTTAVFDEFQISSNCIVTFSVTNVQGVIIKSSVLETSNCTCKFMYKCMCIFLFFLLMHVHV